MKVVRIKSRIPSNGGPKVSVLIPPGVSGRGRVERIAFARESAQRAAELIGANYGVQFAERCRRSIAKTLSLALDVRSNRSGSMAFYWTSESVRVVRSPVAVRELVIVADEFHIKPLLQARQNAQVFVALIETTEGFEILRVLPTKLETIAHYRATALEGALPRQALKTLTAALEVATPESRGVPLLVVGAASWIMAVTKSLATVSSPKVYLAVKGREDFRADGLYVQARKMMQPYFMKRSREALKRLRLAKARGYRVEGIALVAKALAAGLVAELFVVDDRIVWGKLNRKTGEISCRSDQLDARDGDLLDALIHEAQRRNAIPHVVPSKDLPGHCSAVAILTPSILAPISAVRQGSARSSGRLNKSRKRA